MHSGSPQLQAARLDGRPKRAGAAGWQHISRARSAAAFAHRLCDHVLAVDPQPHLGSEPGSRRQHPDLQKIEHQTPLGGPLTSAHGQFDVWFWPPGGRTHEMPPVLVNIARALARRHPKRLRPRVRKAKRPGEYSTHELGIQPDAYDPKLDVGFTPRREQDLTAAGLAQAA